MCDRLRDRLRRCCGRLTVEMGPLTPGTRLVKLWQAAAAEGFATLFLTLLGCGAWIETTKDAQPSHIRIALVFGLLYGVLMYILRYISGGHINPAVTFAILARRQISIMRALLYIVGQCLGAVIGAAILLGLTPNTHQGTLLAPLGATMPQDAVSPSQAFGAEFMATLIFVFIYVAVNDRVKGEANPEYLRPIIIALTLVACELFAIPLSGGSLNPARSLGPAVVKVAWNQHWLYWFGPILGAVAGALIYDFVFASTASLSRVKKCMTANEKKPSRARDMEKAQSPDEMDPLKSTRTPSPSPPRDDATVLHEEDEMLPRKQSITPPPSPPPTTETTDDAERKSLTGTT